MHFNCGSYVNKYFEEVSHWSRQTLYMFHLRKWNFRGYFIVLMAYSEKVRCESVTVMS